MLRRTRSGGVDVERGFTLTELLVVMVIIGVLAAIALPLFISQQHKAAESTAKSDVANIGREVVSYYVDGSLPLAASSSGTRWRLTDAAAGGAFNTTGQLSPGNSLTGTATDATHFCITVTPAMAGASAETWSFGAAGLVAGDGC